MPVFSGRQLACLRSDRLIFSGLGFDLPGGSALVLTGRNGSGKTSLLRLMAGLIPPWHGRLTWNGNPIADDMERHRNRLHFIGHQDAVKPAMTPLEGLTFWAGLWDPRAPERRAAAALHRFGLAAVLDLPCRLLSAGQKRRVNLSRLLVASVPLWLLDEPTGSLDRATVALLGDLIVEHRNRGGVVVLSTHTDLPLAGAAELHLDDYAGLGPAAHDHDQADDGEDIDDPNDAAPVPDQHPAV